MKAFSPIGSPTYSWQGEPVLCHQKSPYAQPVRIWGTRIQAYALLGWTGSCSPGR